MVAQLLNISTCAIYVLFAICIVLTGVHVEELRSRPPRRHVTPESGSVGRPPGAAPHCHQPPSQTSWICESEFFFPSPLNQRLTYCQISNIRCIKSQTKCFVHIIIWFVEFILLYDWQIVLYTVMCHNNAIQFIMILQKSNCNDSSRTWSD